VTRVTDDDSLADGAHFVRTGHFAYESGDHGDTWLTLDLLFVDPRWLHRAAARLAERLRPFAPDVVCGPLIGGALVAQPVAAALGASFVYAERHASGAVTGAGPMAAGYTIPPASRATLAGKRIVVVDDVINAGSATVACAREVRDAGGQLIGAASLILRSGADGPVGDRLGVPIECLHSVRWNIWPAAGCPLCGRGVPLDAQHG
jgi:orotate phosphoribosyltransferase